MLAHMRMHFSTIMFTKTCGDETTMAPAMGNCWKTVMGMSPVPGGMSMSR